MDAVTLLGLEQDPGGKTVNPFGLMQRPVTGLVEAQRRAAAGGTAAMPTRGAAPFGADVSILDVRDATEAEIEESLLPSTSRDGTSQRAPAIQVMRARHHAIARLLAAGSTIEEAARTVGMSSQTVDLLQRSPQFQTLLFSYMQTLDNFAAEYRAKLEKAGVLAVDELVARLAETPGEFSNEELRKTLEGISDRTGHGPTSKVLSGHVALTAADLRELKAAAAQETVLSLPSPASRQIDVTPVHRPDTREQVAAGGAPIREGSVEGTTAETGAVVESPSAPVDRVVGTE